MTDGRKLVRSYQNSQKSLQKNLDFNDGSKRETKEGQPRVSTINSALDELTVKSQFLRNRIPRPTDDLLRDDRQTLSLARPQQSLNTKFFTANNSNRDSKDPTTKRTKDTLGDPRENVSKSLTQLHPKLAPNVPSSSVYNSSVVDRANERLFNNQSDIQYMINSERMRIKQTTTQDAKVDPVRKRSQMAEDSGLKVAKDGGLPHPNSLMPLSSKGDKKKITLTKSSQR